jgi:hypothetical protein
LPPNSSSTIVIIFLFPLLIFINNYWSPSFSSCLSSLVIFTLFLFILRNVVLSNLFIHFQSNPLLFFVILFYLIEHQTNPLAHPSNFSCVFEVVGRML